MGTVRTPMSRWGWELTDTARRDFDGLDDHARDRLSSKLDAIVTDEWREPVDHLEPLAGAFINSVLEPFGSAVMLTTSRIRMCGLNWTSLFDI